MRKSGTLNLLLAITICLGATACAPPETSVDIDKIKAQKKTFVTSETCKTCHLEHYDSWKATNHSRMAQDVAVNEDAFIVDIDHERIKKDFTALEEKGKLKKPVGEIYFPEKSEILYTLGNEWKQRYIVKKDDTLFISPIQYNVSSDRWVNYHEADWDKRPWLLKCGGCHTTGTNLEAGTFTEPGVGCEGCHGAGSWHAALPKTAIFEKRQTIINPAKLPRGTAAQVCGSCHNRGSSTMVKGAGWPVGHEPGMALGPFYKSTSFAAGDDHHLYPNEFSKGHHQQYIDWLKSAHFSEGVSCVSCHYVHQLGMSPQRFQTKNAGSKTCLSCHTVINNNKAHAIHSFANCIGCHMPKIAKSAESNDIHSHVFTALLPQGTLDNPAIPNSCQTCHEHKDADLAKLQKEFKALSQLPKPQGKVISISEQ